MFPHEEQDHPGGHPRPHVVVSLRRFNEEDEHGSHLRVLVPLTGNERNPHEYGVPVACTVASGLAKKSLALVGQVRTMDVESRFVPGRPVGAIHEDELREIRLTLSLVLGNLP